jgi:hypothetical protein
MNALHVDKYGDIVDADGDTVLPGYYAGDRAALFAAAPELAQVLRTLADYAEARERGGDDAVPARLRNISDAQMADAINAARVALAKVDA